MDSRKVNEQILEEAVDWLIEMSSGDADSPARQRFDAWLRTSPEHLRAYLELLPVWEDGACLPPHRNALVDELIAMGKRPDPNVVSHPSLPRGRESHLRENRTIIRPRVAVAASILLSVTAAAVWFYADRGTYTTATGEQRSLTLEDGSTINLNAHSKVRVRFTHDQRAIELIDGQALFDVTKDAARPFVVESDKTRIRAVGTQFDVNHNKRGTIVTVVEGTVAVLSRTSAEPTRASASDGMQNAPAGTSDESLAAAGNTALHAHKGELLVTAGEQVTVYGAAAPHTVRANLATATAWTQRRLVFDASTLGEVVEEFNRYNTRRLVVSDPALESFPITAAFSSPDPASLVRFLEAQPGIRITVTSDAIEISSRP